MKPIHEYYTELRDFDWGYEHSGDYNVWKKTHNQYSYLTQCSELSETHSRLYRDFKHFIFRGGNKPKLEDYLKEDLTLGRLGFDEYPEPHIR